MNSVPSPTDTMSTNWSVPAPRSATQVNTQQHPRRVGQQQNNIDPRLQSFHHLVPPVPRDFHTVQNNVDIANPLLRFYQDVEPWNPHKLRNSNVNTDRNNFAQSEGRFRSYREGPHSVDSNALVSDSGYYTHPTRSVFSNDPQRTNEELPAEVMTQTKNMNVEPAHCESQEMKRVPSDRRSMSQYSNRSGNPKPQFPCVEPGCSVVSKCQSEHKCVKMRFNFTNQVADTLQTESIC